LKFCGALAPLVRHSGAPIALQFVGCDKFGPDICREITDFPIQGVS
jgi:hypothetical protein